MPPSPLYGAPQQSSQSSSRPNRGLADEVRYVIRSSQPAIVFSSLAHVCVPIFSDECTVDIVEDDELAYRIAYPRTDPGQDRAPTRTRSDPRWTNRGYAVRTRFVATDYSGTMTHLWRSRVPTPTDVSRALILVRHGVDTVHAERQGGGDGQHHESVDQLQALAAVDATIEPPVARTLDPAVAELLAARARRLRQWARCETEHIARG